jgi:hypothetical protein
MNRRKRKKRRRLHGFRHLRLGIWERPLSLSPFIHGGALLYRYIRVLPVFRGKICLSRILQRAVEHWPLFCL